MPPRPQALWATLVADGQALSDALSDGRDPNAWDEHGRTALQAALHEALVLRSAEDGDPLASVRRLLAAGADPNRRSSEVLAHPLNDAVGDSEVHVEAVSLLLDAGADPDASRNGGGQTALHQVARLRFDRAIDLATRLLAAGASVHVPDGKGLTPLGTALDAEAFGRETRMAALLAQHYQPARDEKQQDFLSAVHHARPDVVRLLVGRGAERARLKKPAQLMAAALLGDLGAARALLAAGVRPDAFKGLGDKRNGYTSVLAVAAREGHAEIVRALLDQGASVDQGYHSATALLAAAERGHAEIVSTLLAAGATNGRLALAGAAERGHLAVLEALLAAGAAPRLYAITRAASGRQLAALDRLLAAYPESAEPEPGFDAVMVALVRDGARDVLERLLRIPTLRAARSDDGKTLVEVARESGHDELAASLLAQGAPAASDRLAEVLGRWRAALATHRRDWPEWASLEHLAAEEAWRLEVVHGADRLVHRSRELSVGVLPDDGAITPGWLRPLYELMPAREHLNRTGGLVAEAIFDLPLSRERCPAATRIPRGTRGLQLTRRGAPMGVDGKDDVLGLSSGVFRAVGPLEPFVRYCVGEVLAGRWWDAGLKDEAGLAAHGLRSLARMPD